MKSIEARIAEELGARDVQVKAAVELLDGGATVPFIARYRKEVTGGLDDTLFLAVVDLQLAVQERHDDIVVTVAMPSRFCAGCEAPFGHSHALIVDLDGRDGGGSGGFGAGGHDVIFP